MKITKYNYENLIMYQDTMKKIHLRGLYMLMLVLCGAILLCSCGENPASDEVIMELSGEAVSDEKEWEKDIQKNAADAEEQRLSISNITAGSEENAKTDDTETQLLYIYMCGAVVSPGVYQLKEGSRLYEAVEMAGGLTKEADETCLNLARLVSDGEQIVILTCEETDKLKQEGKYTLDQENTAIAVNASSNLVNINTASISELTTVSGIGESRAQAIIDYREKNGDFRCIEDIKKVEGIKDGLFSKIKDKITV